MKKGYIVIFLFLVFIVSILVLALFLKEPNSNKDTNEETGESKEDITNERNPDIISSISKNDSLRIAALGDSLTQGDCDEQEIGYPGRLIRLITNERPESEIENFGRSGWTIENMLNGLDSTPSQVDLALEWNPNIVLLWAGSNDLWYLYEYNNPSSEDEKNDLETYKNNLDQILKRFQDSEALVFIALLDDQSKRSVAIDGEAFSSISLDELEKMSVQVQRYNEAIVEKADEYNAVVVDFYATDIFTEEATLCDDGNHPNGNGYDKIANIWFSEIIKYI